MLNTHTKNTKMNRIVDLITKENDLIFQKKFIVL